MGALPLDYPEWNADRDEIPFDADSVVEIHAYHFLEHCVDPVRVLLECQRVMRKGAVMNIVVPYYKSEMAHHDLDHKHFFTEDTFKVLFNTPYYNKHKIHWHLSVHCCFIMGIVERNLALFVQLVKA
jgi:predicted SAM-dependent methyltransferase